MGGVSGSGTGVDRRVRRRFVNVVVFGSTAAAIALSFRGVDTKVAQITVDGLLTLALAVACTYLGASSVDYTFGDRGAFRRGRPAAFNDGAGGQDAADDADQGGGASSGRAD